MMKDELIAAVLESGFDEYRELKTSQIIFSDLVFQQCARNACGNYGKNYACPPLSGDMEQNKARMLKYNDVLLINKIVKFERTRAGMEDTFKILNESIIKLRKLTETMPVMIATPGGCDICKECGAKTGEPCRFPNKVRYSVEGSGIDVCTMSIEQKMTYNGGNRNLGFFYMIFYN